LNSSLFEIGMAAPEVVCGIVKANLEISSIYLRIYTSTKALEEEPIRQIRISVTRMIHHGNPDLEERIILNREEITPKNLNIIADALSERRALSVCSIVKCSDRAEIFHIPMMDFRCEASPENLEKIKEFLTIIGQRGIILASGRSYHFYGVELLSEKNWLNFLGKCLLFIDPKDPNYIYTDPRYIGHRLMDGYAMLRISKEPKRPFLPSVVSII